MTQKLTRAEILNVLETVFWMITVCAIILQFACGLYILTGKDIAVMKWWYAGSVIAFCVFGLLAVTVAYKIRRVNITTQHAVANARIALLLSWVCFPAFSFMYGWAALNLFLVGRTDAWALVYAPVLILTFSLVNPVLLYLETRAQKSACAS